MNHKEKRFKHKLNMLEPGTLMLKCMGILILIGLILYVFQFSVAAKLSWILIFG